MVLRKFNAKVIDDFKNEWLILVSAYENMNIEEAADAYGSDELDALDERIAGEVVTLTENSYQEGSNDFFEVEDNNFVIFPELFEEI